MNARRYRDFLMRALHDPDRSTLDKIAAHLADCEQAKQILIARGYGDASITASDMARLVPVVKGP